MADNLTQPLLIVNTQAQVAGQITPSMSQSSTASYAANQTLNQTLVLHAGQQYAPDIGFSSLVMTTTGPVHLVAAIGTNPAAINQIVNQQATIDTAVDSFTVTNNGTTSVTVKLLIAVSPNTATRPVGVVTSLNSMTADINLVQGPGINVASGLQTITVSNTGVLSLNGQTGIVTLDAGNLPGISRVGVTGQYSDIIGIPSAYVLPVATANVLGGVKVGSGLVATQDGTLSAIPHVDLVTSVNTLQGVVTIQAVDNGASGSQSLIANSGATTGNITLNRLAVGGSGLAIGTINGVTTISSSGLQGAVLSVSGQSPAPNGSVVIQAVDNAGTGTSLIQNSGATTGNMTFNKLVPGNNIALAPDSNGNVVITGTVNAYNLPVATGSVLGGVKQGANVSISGDGTISVAAPFVLTSATSTVLGGVKQGANVNIALDGTISVAAPYVLPAATASSLGGVQQGAGVSIDVNGVLSANVLTVAGRTGAVTLAVSDVSGAAATATLAAAGGAALIGTSEGPTVQQSLDTLNTKLTNALVNTSVAATSLNQTVYAIPGGYPINLIDVYAMGVHLDPSDFSATDGLNVIVSSAIAAKMPIGAKLLVRSIGSFNVANAATLAQLGGTGGASLIGYGAQTVSQALDTLNNGTANDAGTLLASDKFSLSRGTGALTTQLGSVGNFMASVYPFNPYSSVSGTVSRTPTSFLNDLPVSAKWFGAVGDGVTDDTAAIQAWATFVVTNKRRGYLPEGTYMLSAAIVIPQGGNYSFIGSGRASTILRQTVANLPIFDMGGTGSASCVFIEMAEMWLDYSVTPVAGAYAIYMRASYFLNSFHHLRMTGYYCFKVAAGQPAPQNTVFDEIDMLNSTTGGFMDWTSTGSAGPNNVIGRLQLGCLNAVGPIFNNIKGVNFVIDCLEFLQVTNANLMTLQAGSNVSINSIKMEFFTFNTSGNLFVFNTNCNVKINQFFCYGTTSIFQPATGSFTLFKTDSGGSTGSLHIDLLDLTANTVGSNVYAVEALNGSVRINQYVNDGNANWNLSSSSSATPDVLEVSNYNNKRISTDKGDANYSIALGDPTVVSYETALTAPRTVQLPLTVSNLFNGLRYTVRSNGAVNGTNTITVQCNGVNKFVIATDLSAVDFVYRRSSSAQAGWNIERAYGLSGGISGVASGDLSGSYPSPTVAQVTGLNLFTEAANSVSQYNGTNAQSFRFYNFRNSVNDYERGEIFWQSNTFTVGTRQGGTGSARNIGFYVNGNYRWQIGQTQLFPQLDATYDIGLTGQSVRNVYTSGINVNKGSIVTVPTTGQTVTVAQTTNFQVAQPAGTLAALTIQFPTPLADGHMFELSITQSITALTLTPNSGASIVGGLTSVTTYSATKWRYVASTTTWYQAP